MKNGEPPVNIMTTKTKRKKCHCGKMANVKIDISECSEYWYLYLRCPYCKQRLITDASTTKELTLKYQIWLSQAKKENWSEFINQKMEKRKVNTQSIQDNASKVEAKTHDLMRLAPNASSQQFALITICLSIIRLCYRIINEASKTGAN